MAKTSLLIPLHRLKDNPEHSVTNQDQKLVPRASFMKGDNRTKNWLMNLPLEAGNSEYFVCTIELCQLHDYR